jgi:lysophospholipase L1-like esterase
VVLGVEIFFFGLVTLSNYIIYGHIREGARVVYDPYALFIREDGPRPTLHNADQSAENVVTVWMFGGSTIKGATDDDAKTIPSLVAKTLNRGDKGPKYHFTNFGMSSYNSILEAKYLQKQLIENPNKPDLILFYDGANDSTYFNEFRTRYAHFGYRRMKAIIENYHYSWFGILKPVTAAINSSFTKEAIEKLMAVYDPIEATDPEFKKIVENMGSRYDYINKVALCFDAKFTLVWQPILWAEDCEIEPSVKDMEHGSLLSQDKYSTLKENLIKPYLAMEEALGDKPYFHNMRNALCERKMQTYKPDGVHLADAGREMMAGKIADIIEDEMNPGIFD